METPPSPSGTRKITVEIPSVDSVARRRPLIPGSFGLVIVFFFFTFCDFKCGGQRIMSVSGIDLVTGTEVTGYDSPFGNAGGSDNRSSENRDMKPNIWAIVALGAAAVGLGTFLIRSKREEYIGIGVGLLGAVALVVLRFTLIHDIEKESKGFLQVSFRFGYWGALLGLLVAGVLCFLRLRIKRREKTLPLPDLVTVPGEVFGDMTSQEK